MKTQKMVIMGVSGCGKSLIGSLLAEKLQLPFFDGDDYHSSENIRKMSQGVPLTAQDRQGWLETLNMLITQNSNIVLACSALNPEYRKILSRHNPDLVFIYLQGDFDTIWQRHQKRDDHYFNGKSLLESQFAALVEPSVTEALIIDIRQTVKQLIDDILHKLTIINNYPQTA